MEKKEKKEKLEKIENKSVKKDEEVKPTEKTEKKPAKKDEGAKTVDKSEKKPVKNAKNKKARSKKIGIAVFVIGLIVLVAGLTVLIIKKTAQPLLDDAEFLITAGQWVREDQPEVVWDFTEVGKGTLTTDNHQNDYNFTWKLDNSKILIETDWLYSFYDSFDYVLNQGEKTFTVKNPDKNIEIKFIAKERPAKTEEQPQE